MQSCTVHLWWTMMTMSVLSLYRGKTATWQDTFGKESLNVIPYFSQYGGRWIGHVDLKWIVCKAAKLMDCTLSTSQGWWHLFRFRIKWLHAKHTTTSFSSLHLSWTPPKLKLWPLTRLSRPMLCLWLFVCWAVSSWLSSLCPDPRRYLDRTTEQYGCWFQWRSRKQKMDVENGGKFGTRIDIWYIWYCFLGVCVSELFVPGVKQPDGSRSSWSAMRTSAQVHDVKMRLRDSLAQNWSCCDKTNAVAALKFKHLWAVDFRWSGGFETKDQEGTPIRKQQLVHGCDILPETVCLAELCPTEFLELLGVTVSEFFEHGTFQNGFSVGRSCAWFERKPSTFSGKRHQEI